VHLKGILETEKPFKTLSSGQIYKKTKKIKKPQKIKKPKKTRKNPKKTLGWVLKKRFF
jgi:hypothetical protein